MFSTTAIWNSRGRQTIAAAARNVTLTQRGPKASCECSSAGDARAKMSAGPPATTKTTTTPTTSRATSFTTASTAMAATTPWCCSFASMLRVPKMMVNTAMPTAIQKATRKSVVPAGRPASASGTGLPITWKLVATAFSCNAM